MNAEKDGKKKQEYRQMTIYTTLYTLHYTHNIEWIAQEGKSYIRGLPSRLNLFGFAVNQQTKCFRTREILMPADKWQKESAVKWNIQSNLS